jgi:hypothetical protein
MTHRVIIKSCLNIMGNLTAEYELKTVKNRLDDKTLEGPVL